VFIGALFMSKNHPQLRAVITALAAAMEDSSALVFLLFNLLHFNVRLGLDVLSLSWLALSGAVAICTWVLLPSAGLVCRNCNESAHVPEGQPSVGVAMREVAPVPPPLIASSSEVELFAHESCKPTSSAGLPHRAASDQSSSEPTSCTDLLACAAASGAATCSSRAGGEHDSEQSAACAPHKEASRARQHAKTKSFSGQFCRTDTMLLVAFMATFNLKCSFTLTTIADQMGQLFDHDTATQLATAFNVAFPLGGLITSILAALLLQYFDEREDIYITISLVLILIYCLFSLFPYVTAQYVAMLLFGPSRTLQWATYFHLLSQPSRYSQKFNGRLIGYGNLIIALVGNVPPYTLNKVVSNNDNIFGFVATSSTRYLAVHLVLFLTMLTSIALPVNLSHSLSISQQST